MPVLSNFIPNQYAQEGVAFSYTFPSNTFTGTGLTYEAVHNRPYLGYTLRPWLTFNPATRTFSGTPTNWYDLEALQIVVKCTDSVADVKYSIFTLVVGASDNTGRTVFRSGTTPEHTLTAANIAAYNVGTISAGQWVCVDTDVTVSGAALTTITNVRSAGGFIVWKINASNRSGFNFLNVNARETVALDFDSGSLGYFKFLGKLDNGLRGAEIMFTNWNKIGKIKDDTYNPITLWRQGALQDKHIRFIGQPEDHEPYTKVYGIGFESIQYTLLRAASGFQHGIELAYVEIGPGGAIGVHLKTNLINTGALIEGDRRPSFNTGGLDFNMKWLQIHDCYTHDVEGEAVYMGGGFYAGKDSVVNTFYHDIEYGRVEHCLCLDSGWDAIQAKNVIRGLRVMNNYVLRTGVLPGASNAQRFGIFIGDGSAGEVAYNWVELAGQSGLRIYDSGYTLVHNNVVIDSGDEAAYGARVADPAYNDNPAAKPLPLLINKSIPTLVYNTAPTTAYTSRADLADGALKCHIFNNTFVNALDTLSLYIDTPPAQVRVQNNLWVNCGRSTISGPSGWTNSGNVMVTGEGLDTVFVDPVNKDFRILAASIADGSGVDISAVFTEVDYNGESRASNKEDVGAFIVGSTINTDRYNYVVNAGAPGVNAGVDLVIYPPQVNVKLLAVESGSIGSRLWTQLSGPNTATITNPTTVNPTISDMIAGIYEFQIVSTGSGLGSAQDTIIINMSASSPATTFHVFYQADDNVGTGADVINVTTDVSWQVPTGLNKWFRRGTIPKAKTGTSTGVAVYTPWVNVV